MAETKNGEDGAVASKEIVPTIDNNDASANVNIDPTQQVFKNLLILPPLQKVDNSSSGSAANQDLTDAVPLPPIRAEEPVSSIRAALSEIKGYSHLTNYRFVLENSNRLKEKDASSKNTSSKDIASPYTGLNAIIATKQVVKSFLDEAELTNNATPQEEAKQEGLVLDEYGDLTSLFRENGQGLEDGSSFRVVLERYDIALIHDHIARLRTLLDGNAPTSVSLDESAGDAAAAASEQATQQPRTDATEPNGRPNEGQTANGKEINKEEQQQQQKQQQKAIDSKQKSDIAQKDMPVFSIGKSLSPDVNDLKKFFYYACGEDPSLYLSDSDSNKKEIGNGASKSKKKGKKRGKSTAEGGDKTNDDEKESKQQLLKQIIPQLNEIEERTRVSCDIRFSGFHPPPQHRQLMGDLAYLEVTLPDGELVSVSATPIGFYVNRSSLTRGDYKFDPSPSVKPCFSHELLDCLMHHSISFSAAWSDALAAAKTRADLMLKINEDGPFQSFFRVAIRGDFPGYKKPSVASAAEGIDALVQIPSWLVPFPRVELEAEHSWNRNCEHTYSSARTEGEISNSFGVDIRNGSLRDWNEELQVAREMPMGNLLERIERARYVYCVGWTKIVFTIFSFTLFD